MRRFATTTAVIGFFGLALVGWASGVPPFTCAARAAAGGAVLYVASSFACRVAVKIAADVIMNESARRQDKGANS